MSDPLFDLRDAEDCRTNYLDGHVASQPAPRVQSSSAPVSDVRTLGRGCWCGGELGHEWPGKYEGAAHPRIAS